jgi:hypothetical protein
MIQPPGNRAAFDAATRLRFRENEHAVFAASPLPTRLDPRVDKLGDTRQLHCMNQLNLARLIASPSTSGQAHRWA